MPKDPDSVKHHDDRSAQMRAVARNEARQQAQELAQREEMQADRRAKAIDAEELRISGLPLSEVTREQLLQRIRAMRDEKVEVVREYYISPGQQAQLELEQKAGREAVERAEAQRKRYLEAQALVPVEQSPTEGTMVPVHHPNPSQTEQYPAIKATLGKTK